MMRRNFAAGLAMTLAAFAMPAQAQVPVGAIEILSGPNAAYGVAIKAGLELALDEVNRRACSAARRSR